VARFNAAKGIAASDKDLTCTCTACEPVVDLSCGLECGVTCKNAKYIEDDPDFDHNIPLKKRPGEKHRLHQQLSTRGEKVEILHTVQGDFANGNKISTRAEALTLEGTVRFLMKESEKRL